jgi:hypothetical protein
LFRKTEDLHFRIQCGKSWNQAEEIYRVKAHPHHIIRLVWGKRKIESHASFYKAFGHFSRFSKKEFRDERRNSI